MERQYILSDFRDSINKRFSADTQISAWWILGGLLTLGILFFVLFYKLIERRNNHFMRQKSLEESVIKLVEIGDEEKRDLIYKIERVHKEGEEIEFQRRPPILWVILSFLTYIATFYVLWFLTNDIEGHADRQKRFLSSLLNYFDAKGIVGPEKVKIGDLNDKPMPQRSTLLYLIVTIITVGFFGLYWIYSIIKDYNEHFKIQWSIEDSLARIFEEIQ